MKPFIPALLIAVLLPSCLFAQGVAISGGIGLPLYVTEMPAYETSYVAPFLFLGSGTTEGSQALTLDQVWRPSFWGEVEWFPNAHAGLLLRAGHRHTPLDGSNTPYNVSVDYISRQPPSYEPQHFHVDNSEPWPDTNGHLDRWEFDVAATFAYTAPSRLRAHIDGGLALVSTSGRFEPIGVTTHHFGGHSVVFSNEYELVMAVPRMWAATAVVSGGLTLPIAPRVGVDVSGRFVLPRTVSADVHVSEVGGDTAIAELTAADAEHILKPEPVTLKLATFEVLVGLRVRL